MNVERELKWAVDSEDNLAKIERASGGVVAATVLQINSFFDTADLKLRAQKITCRLRDEAGTFYLTAKAPFAKSAGGDLSEKLEEEIELSAADVERLRTLAAPPLTFFPKPRAGWVDQAIAEHAGAKWKLIGSFENRRTRVASQLAKIPVVLELDVTVYPDGSRNYEVEVEVPKNADLDGIRAGLFSLFKTAGVAPKQSGSKARRLFQILETKPG